ncbi:MAG: cysteine desulfurase CsdA [Marinilabiliales bacterium]|jgi:cysteine desulfurase/selenocysteine lyase|nr:MAG: cysteine desulfurase CsdA [Marinilabiliales bacterium]
MLLDIEQIRKDFPILKQTVNGKPLVYLDNAATTQKPVQVINRMVAYYENENSNVHRGVHQMSQLATDAYESARKYIANYIHASDPKEVIFTRGATESINLIANIFETFVNEGDEIVITSMEHHSNLVPWQQLCVRTGAGLIVIPVNEEGELDTDQFKNALNEKTRLVALAHISNVLGTINPVKEITQLAHEMDVPVLIDGAQAIAHIPVDVSDIDCEFYTFSGHKAYAPMGIGVLYGKTEWLDKLPPYQFGGEMIESVHFDATTFNELPYKFEAGTPNVEGALGLEAAIRYIDKHGIENIRKYEDELLAFATSQLNLIEDLQIIGTAAQKTAVISFIVDGVHAYDIGTLLDKMGIAIRTGNHCAQPLVESFGLTGTIRMSLAMYNTKKEIELFMEALIKVLSMLR